MSVFKSVETKALSEKVDFGVLERSLKELNLEMSSNIKKVSNLYGSSTVDYGLLNNGKPISLGFKKNDRNGLTLEGDPFGCDIKDRFGKVILDGQHQQIMNAISQLYQKNLLYKNLRKNGWNVKTSNSLKNKKDIVLTCEIL